MSSLQALCAIAVSVLEKREAHVPEGRSLVVCPSALTAHWVSQMQQFLPSLLRPNLITSADLTRSNIKEIACNRHEVVVASFETVRRDGSQKKVLPSVQWAHVVVDEAHVLRNPAAATSQAVQSVCLRAPFRVLLSGTPVQNQVGQGDSHLKFLIGLSVCPRSRTCGL